MGRIEGKTAIVTGAAQGIGLAIARRFAAEGARVLLADQNRQGVEAAAAELGQEAGVVDVSVRAEVEAMVDHATTTFGRVDILVNNAGVLHGAGLMELSEADFDRVMAINLKSALFTIQAVAPQMMERGAGAIVNMASVGAVLGSDALAYCVSKAGLVQLTNVAALTLARHGVRVNAVGPGTVDTEMARAAYADPAALERALSRTPMARFAEPEEVAGVVLFLASDDAAYVTGKTIYADGGRMGLNLTVPVAGNTG